LFVPSTWLDLNGDVQDLVNERKIRIQNYTPADLDSYRELCGSAALEENWAGLGDANFVELRLHKPNYSPYTDLFLAKAAGEGVVGFVDLTSELQIKRVVVDGFVHPRCRRQGIGEQLLSQAGERIRELGAEVIHICLDEDSKGARAFLLKQGFKEVRRYLLMEKTLLREWECGRSDELEHLFHLGKGQEGLLADLQNRVFAGSWGFHPNSREDVCYYLALTGIETQDVLLAKDGEKIVGYLWQQVVDDRQYTTDAKRGWIHMFGVLDRYRGQKWGQRLLMSGLHRLVRQGVGRVDLTVDEKNQPAVNLYKNLDFTIKSHKIWYEKSV
jgi:mycothiol synthase